MKKVLKISIIVVLIMILLIGGVFAYLYFGTDIFKGDKELFFKYMGQNLNTAKEIFIDKDVLEYGKRQKTESYTSEGEFKKEANNNSSITFTGETDKVNNYLYRKFDVNTSETKKISAEYLQNNEKYGVKVENVTPKYVVIENKNLKQWAQKLGLEQTEIDMIPDSIDFDEILNKKIFTDEEEKQIQDRYLKVLMDNLKDDMFSKNQIDGNKVYTLTLNETQLKEISKEILKVLKDDEQIWNKVKDLIVEYGKVDEAKAMEYINQMKEELDKEINKEEIDKGFNINSFNSTNAYEGFDTDMNSFESKKKENTLKINVFVKSKKAVKTEMILSEEEKINIINNNNEMKISFLENDKEQGYVVFKKEKQNDNVKYNFNVSQDGNDYMNLVINFDGMKSEQAKESYTLTVNNYENNANYTYKNTKNFTKNIEKKDFKQNDELVLNGHTIEEITNVLGPVITQAMQSNEMQSTFNSVGSEVLENITAIIPLGLVSTLQNPSSLPIVYMGTGASVMMVAVQNSIVSNVKPIVPDKDTTNIETNTNTNPLEAQQMEAFNSKFKVYEGNKKSASEIRALYSAVKSNNAASKASGNTSRQITINGLSGTDFSIPTISASTTYTVKLTYTNGYVTGITTVEETNNNTTTSIQESTNNNSLSQAEETKLKTFKASAQEIVEMSMNDVYANMLMENSTSRDLTGKEENILAVVKRSGATESTCSTNKITYVKDGYSVEVKLNSTNTAVTSVGEPQKIN